MVHIVARMQRSAWLLMVASLCESAGKAMRIRKSCVRHSGDATATLEHQARAAEKLLPSRICLANLPSLLARVKGHRLQDLAVEQPYVSPFCGHGDLIAE